MCRALSVAPHHDTRHPQKTIIKQPPDTHTGVTETETPIEALTDSRQHNDHMTSSKLEPQAVHRKKQKPNKHFLAHSHSLPQQHLPLLLSLTRWRREPRGEARGTTAARAHGPRSLIASWVARVRLHRRNGMWDFLDMDGVGTNTRLVVNGGKHDRARRRAGDAPP